MKVQYKKFGLVVGGIFIFIAFWPMVRGRDYRLWALIPGVLLFVMGAVYPPLLKQPYKLWMALAHVLGWINTRIILGLVYFVIMTPLALILKLMGKDSLQLKLENKKQTYRESLTSSQSMERQF